MTYSEVIKKAISTARRKIVGRQKGGCLTRLAADLKEGINLKSGPPNSTASWHWNGKRHVIAISPDLPIFADKPGVTDAAKKDYVVAVIRHECEHGRQTDRTSEISDQCEKRDIPFYYFNLFEDCRIEFKGWLREGLKWGWSKWETIETFGTNSACTALHSMKQQEAGSKSAPLSYCPTWTGSPEIEFRGKLMPTRRVIGTFYREAIAKAASIDLLPLVEEFVKIFGKSQPLKVVDNEINGKTDPNAPKKKTNEITKKEVQISRDKTPWSDWSTGSAGQGSKDMASRIAARLQSLVIRGCQRPTRTALSGPRLHLRNAISGAPDAFRGLKKEKGKRRVCLVVDMSGSMQSTWNIKGGKEFVAAFQMLADRGLIQLDILLSAVACGHKTTKARRTPAELMTLRQRGNNREGIRQTLDHWAGEVCAADVVIVWTDGCIGTGEVEAATWRNRGVDIIGAMITEPRDMAAYREAMDKHFSKSYLGTDANELAQRVVNHVIGK
jgi:hypothetical protein